MRSAVSGSSCTSAEMAFSVLNEEVRLQLHLERRQLRFRNAGLELRGRGALCLRSLNAR